MPPTQSILPTPSGRRRRRLTMALAALAALFSVASTAQAKTNHHHHASVVRSAPLHAKKATTPAAPPRNPYAGLANYAAGFMTNGNVVPQGGDRSEPGFAGWADYARGYLASHPAA